MATQSTARIVGEPIGDGFHLVCFDTPVETTNAVSELSHSLRREVAKIAAGELRVLSADADFARKRQLSHTKTRVPATRPAG